MPDPTLTRNPLRLLPRRIASWTSSGDFHGLAAITDFDWTKRPVSAADAANVPMLWCPASCAFSLGLDLGVYLASDSVVVLPPGVFGKAGVPVRKPRFLTYEFNGESPSLMRTTIEALGTDLSAANVFSGEQVGNVGGYAVLGLPPTSYTDVSDDDPGFTPLVTPMPNFVGTDARGGESLHILIETINGGGSAYTFLATAGGAPTPKTNTAAAAAAYLTACAPAHEKVKWLLIQAGRAGGDVTSDLYALFLSVAQDVKTAVGSTFEVFVTGGYIGIDPGVEEAVRAKITATIKDFFGI